MDFVTLGSFILDDIYEFPPVRQPMIGVLGGAGLYAAQAARIFASQRTARKIGLLIHMGTDFPQTARDWIEGFDMHAKFIERVGSLTTRGMNMYDEQGNRTYAFLHPNIRIDAKALDEELLASKTFHMICTPERCISLCEGILAGRQRLRREESEQDGRTAQPVFVWEPMEGACQSNELSSFGEALRYVDVFSPNEHELLSLCDMRAQRLDKFNPSLVRSACNKLLEYGKGACLKAIVARCGPYGCVVVEHSSHVTIPAYHSPQENGKSSDYVVDATGGGNSFLGGFCAAVASEAHITGLSAIGTAALYGNVAASYAIEQVGLPEMTVSTNGEEIWNGTRPVERLAKLTQHLRDH